jgi:4-amino-4-deoxy-L-arabinose transferase-like glycosyltransferase
MKAQLARVLRAEATPLHLEPPPVPRPLQWVRELSLVWLFVPLLVSRLPAFAFGVLDIDESDWTIAGRLLGHGALPYVGFVEKKPLLSFLFYLPAAAFGYRQWVMHIVAVAWIFCTALLAGRAVREWTRSEDAGRVAAWLYALGACGGIPAVNAETMMNLPAAAALFWFVRAERSRRLRDVALAGVLVAVASLFKHQAGILLVAFALTIAWEWLRRRSRDPLRLAALVCGFAIPWVAAAALYYFLGHLREFLEWNVWRNLGYAAHGAGSVWPRLVKGVFVGIVAAPVQWWLATREARLPTPDPVRKALVLVFGLTWIPVSLGGRFYEHYFIQFLPVLSVLAAPAALALLERWDGLPPWGRRALAFFALFPVIFWVGHGFVRAYIRDCPLQDPRAQGIAGWIQQNTDPQEQLFIWGHYSPLYYMSDRLPGTRYYTTSVHVGDFDPEHLPDDFDPRPYVSPRDVEQTIDDLERSGTRWVVDTAPSGLHHWNRLPLAAVSTLDEYVRAHFELVAEPAGARVYRRR